jgi:Xaa-Pro aminopeptidase
MDCGAEYANYCADLTRTIPVSGKFSKRQKAVYNEVLHVHNEAKKIMKAGMVLNEFNQEVGKIMEASLIKLQLLGQSRCQETKQAPTAVQKIFSARHGSLFGARRTRCGQSLQALESGCCTDLRAGHLYPR